MVTLTSPAVLMVTWHIPAVLMVTLAIGLNGHITQWYYWSHYPVVLMVTLPSPAVLQVTFPSPVVLMVISDLWIILTMTTEQTSLHHLTVSTSHSCSFTSISLFIAFTSWPHAPKGAKGKKSSKFSKFNFLPPLFIVLFSCHVVHDEESKQASGLCDHPGLGGGHQGASLLQGYGLGSAGAEEGQTTLQTSHCEYHHT